MKKCGTSEAALQIFFLQVVFQAFSFKNPVPETGFFNHYESIFHGCAQ